MYNYERQKLFNIVKFDEPKISEIKVDECKSSFTIEPLIRGYGTTIGNALRRVLLSSMPGVAVISVKIDGILHEFSTIPGVKEDVTEIILNLKKISGNLSSDDIKIARIFAEGPCEVRASDIDGGSELTVSNPDQYIATVAEGSVLSMELKFDNGIGYVSSEENKERYAISTIGEIVTDSIFTPVTNVAYTVEPTRVAGSLNHDRLHMDIETDGSISPEDAISLASRILIDHLSLINLHFKDEGMGEIFADSTDNAQHSHADITIEDLSLSVRSYNCLNRANIRNLAELSKYSIDDLYKIRNFGKKSAEEIQKKMEEYGLSLRDENDA